MFVYAHPYPVWHKLADAVLDAQCKALMSPAHEARITPAPSTPWFVAGSRFRSLSGSPKRVVYPEQGSLWKGWSYQSRAAMADFGITEDTPQKVSGAIAAVCCGHTNGHQICSDAVVSGAIVAVCCSRTNGHQVRSDAVVCKPMAIIHKIDYDQHTEDLVKDHPGADIEEEAMAADGAQPIAKRLRVPPSSELALGVAAEAAATDEQGVAADAGETAAADESVVTEETVTAMSVDQPKCTLLIQPSKRLGKPPFTMIVPCSYTWADCKRDQQFRSQVDVKTLARSHLLDNIPGHFVVSSLDAPAWIAIRARSTLSAAQKAVSEIKCGKRTQSRWLDENLEIVQSKVGALKHRSLGRCKGTCGKCRNCRRYARKCRLLNCSDQEAAQRRPGRRNSNRSPVKTKRIAPLGACPHARMEKEDPLSAETGGNKEPEAGEGHREGHPNQEKCFPECVVILPDHVIDSVRPAGPVRYRAPQKKKSKRARLQGPEQEAEDWACHYSEEWNLSLGWDQNLSHGL